MTKIELRVSPDEIMEHIDDMLAWEAIASQAELDFVWSHFLRAVPFVRIGPDDWGVLTPSSVDAHELDAEDVDDPCDDAAYYNRVLPEFLETQFKHRAVRYAQLVECNASDETVAGAGVEHPTLRGDDVVDLQSADKGAWRGVTYQLESVGELGRDATKQYQQWLHLPQVARVFLHQHVFAFADGRATSNRSGFAYWNRSFREFDGERLLKHIDGDKYFHPSLVRLANAISETLQRAQCWGVELSLGAKRTGVELRTDAIGARAFVKMLRANETPKGRRKSIVHWVNDHMRRRRANDASAEIFVQGHLRGMESVPCGRYHARVWPAQDLVDKSPRRRGN